MPIFNYLFAALLVLAPLTFAAATLVGSALARAGFPLQDASRGSGVFTVCRAISRWQC